MATKTLQPDTDFEKKISYYIEHVEKHLAFIKRLNDILRSKRIKPHVRKAAAELVRHYRELWWGDDDIFGSRS